VLCGLDGAGEGLCDVKVVSNSLMSFFVLWCPELHTVLEVRPHQRRVERDNHFPRPTSDAVLDASQDTVGPPGCQGTLLAHIQLAVNHNPQIPLCGAAFQRLITQSVRIARVAPSQVQDPAFALVKLRVVGDCPALPSVQISLQGLSTL